MNEQTVLRKAITADLPKVASWIKSTRDCELWAGWRVQYPIDIDRLPVAIEFSDENSFGLIHQQALIGFGQVIEKDGKRGHLARLIINPEDRGKGFGKLLVRQLVDIALNGPFLKVSLNVDKSNGAAIAVYRMAGFVEKPRPNDEPPSDTCFYMEIETA